MKKIFLLINLFFSLIAFSQNEQLAMNYFDKGDFEKAVVSFEQLAKEQPGNSLYLQKLVESYQQLQQYDKAQLILEERMKRSPMANLFVELGYNYQLQKNQVKAKKYYEEAIEKVKEVPGYVYLVANAFEKKVLLDYAVETYKLALKLDPKLKFSFQLAVIYGQQGKTDLMIDTFLDEAFENPTTLIMIQNQLSRFMTEESAETSFNASLRKALLVRAQKNQDIFWNQFLSWFYVTQKEYSKAFIQEKAIYRREPESLSSIVNLGQLSLDENEEETAQEIFSFVLENTQDIDLKILSNYYLMDFKIKKAQEKNYIAIKSELEKLMKEFGVSPYSLSLQILQAHFETFNIKNPEGGKAILKRTLELPLNNYQKSDAKMELADILLYEEKFNQALIYYSQIEEDLKNDEIGHEASLKAAKTSYFKTDFDWALKQFKELKSASTQLIANDALELFLLINDNTVADSTQVGLKKFARGDYLLYQNKNTEALAQFQSILKDYKGQEIEDETLLRIGETYQKMGNFTEALAQYQSIIDNHKDGIYIDEALYFSAEIYNLQLKDPEKAKPLYEKILFEHEDSIYFVDARKKFRQLRGDANL
ncbi:tetratricopeptide repeat protein [uncultured Flavobacterium sp.]|uniref:tetratricopeptide repeat protein n=1 Tax=uncultured Flavobacterium sp. TaxID=165435 RepID=UPI0025F1DE66|nr:tetratricopeptide repeat protein [uncultured Flavobacterium sp.]